MPRTAPRRGTFPPAQAEPPKPLPLTAEETARRGAVLRRFKELLTAQRDRFRSYLDALDKSQEVIEHGQTEDLLRHVELEESIVSDILSLQKVIGPLDTMYQELAGGEAGAEAGDGAGEMKAALEGLKTEAAARSRRNRELLSRRMAEIRSEIKALRSNPYTGKRGAAAPTRINLQG